MKNSFFLKAGVLVVLAVLPLSVPLGSRADAPVAADPWAFPVKAAVTADLSVETPLASPQETPLSDAFSSPTPGASVTPGCAAPGASGNNKAARNYAAWCDAELSGVLFEQDDANNGMSYSVFNGTQKPVDVRAGAVGLNNMDSDLSGGWVRVLPRKQADLGRLNAYDPNQDWSGGVTTTAKLAE